MIATRLTLRDFRTYAAAEVQLGPGLTVVTGRNGAGKTNLLEARLLRLHRAARAGRGTSASACASAPS